MPDTVSRDFRAWYRRGSPRRQRLAAALLTALIVVSQARLYLPRLPARDAPAQLRWLGWDLRHGGGQRMQDLFPEGWFFVHALYGLSWVALGRADERRRGEAVVEARWALDQLGREEGMAPFRGVSEPPGGVFAAGWTAWLQAEALSLVPAAARDAAEVARFEAGCRSLAAAFEAAATPYLQAYPARSWPCDSVVAMAALCAHDRLLAPRYGATVARWRRLIESRLDPATGLLPHEADWPSGACLTGARGSSQALLLRFLPAVDPAWARRDYARFRALFAGGPAGLPGVREYPRGERGPMDVDSGPIVGGVGAVASFAALGPALAQGDRALAEPLLQSLELLGAPYTWRGGKRYAFGRLPVADAFLVWAKLADAGTQPWPQSVGWWWRLGWHGLALLLTALIWRLADRRLTAVAPTTLH
ncbi:MAG: hypothetical protein HZB16_23175 [Armatimonadetes bacterium]|nr:hypothetical protein [Armatimonadota bacterium]